MKLLLALIGLIGPVISWLIKNNEATTQAKKERKQEIKDAVFSGNVANINACIQRLRK